MNEKKKKISKFLLGLAIYSNEYLKTAKPEDLARDFRQAVEDARKLLKEAM